MNTREHELKEISTQFAVWESKLSLLGSINLFDANIISEHLVKELLNTIFGYNLISANSIKKNYPAVDLINEGMGVAVQVTATAASRKIQNTINTFLENNLHQEFSDLYILIIGRKQKRYSSLVIPPEISFSADRNIIDLKDLINQISFLPTSKISRVRNIVVSENRLPKNRNSQASESRIRKAMTMKKKIQKDFLLDLPRSQWDYAKYEPWIRFRYHNVILRDPDDKTFPVVDNHNNWLKGEFWDLYDQGIEFISHGGKAVFDQDGYWDILNWNGDERENNPKYTVKDFWTYPRLAFHNIATYDLEPDDYYSSPTIYCTFSSTGHPYDEIMFGTSGSYERGIWRQLFDNTMRKTKGWN